MSVRGFAAHLGVNERTVTKWEAGGATMRPRPELQAALDTTLERASAEAANRFRAAVSAARPAAAGLLDEERPALDRRTVLLGAAGAALVLHDAETLRRQLTDAVDHSAMSDASLDDWEHTVQQYGLAARYRPAASLLTDLTADFAELCRLLEYRRAILVPNRLTRIMAQLAGLMTIPLNQLHQASAARNWARTARIFARQAGDNKLQSWVLAQEACAHYYSGNLAEAAYVAAHAQHIANHAPCPEVANAATREAMARAALGQAEEARAALGRAQHALGRMDSRELGPSAFGYTEARFSFHAGNAYTRLGETALALGAHEQALTLYPRNEYLDPALVMLDRAECLVTDDDVPAAADWVARALQSVETQQRNSMIDNRAREVLSRVPAKARSLPAVREVRELVKVAAMD